MRIHVVNPNTTASMTQKIGAAARAAASPGVEIVATNPAYGPPNPSKAITTRSSRFRA